MVLSDREILDRAVSSGMIQPFWPTQIKEVDGKRIISAGISSYGYDMRIANEFKVFKNIGPILDPKAFDENAFETVEVEPHTPVIVPPNSFLLGRSVEYFRIPRDILCLVVGKSTLARLGLIVNVTPLEPEWEGQVTIEVSNTTPLPAYIYAHEGIGQVIFLNAFNVCETSYKDRAGKYDRQLGVVLSRM